MPSHIFFALGMWEDSITANQASMKTARDRGAGGYHPLHWLEYAYLQEGRREDAARLVSTIEADVARDPAPSARIHLAAARATWLVETRGAGGPSYREPVDASGIAALTGFADHALARGLIALESGDRPAAAAALAELQERIRNGRTAVSAEVGATRFTQVSASELEAAEVMERQLLAALRFAEGRTDDALEDARAAAELQDQGVFEYGPPPSPKPPHELLGELLARMNRHAEARVEFEKALQRTPKRTLALLGLARAAALSGDRATAQTIRAELVAQWKSEAFPVPPLP